jgi:flagellar biogenesis protein FliO
MITFFQAIAYVVTGMYGDWHDLGIFNAVAIILQVCVGQRRSPCLFTAHHRALLGAAV